MKSRLNTAVSIAGAAMIAAVAPPVAAQQHGDTELMCTAADAQPVTIAGIIAAGDAMVGRCVSVDGLAVDRELQADNSARYRQRSRYNDPSSTGAILGLYDNGLYGNTLADNGPKMVRVLGRVENCDAMVAAAAASSNPEEFIMIGGYCHYFRGLAITAQTVTVVGNADMTRIPRGTAEPLLGNISPMADSPARAQLMRAGLAFVMAVQLRQIEGVRRAELGDNPVAAASVPAHGQDRVVTALLPARGTQRSAEDVAAALRQLDDPAGPFAALNTPALVAIEVFGWREPLWADADSRAGNAAVTAAGQREGIVCVSAASNAAALWPIDERDADNAPGRPCACMRITIRPDNVVEFDIERDQPAAPEPRS